VVYLLDSYAGVYHTSRSASGWKTTNLHTKTRYQISVQSEKQVLFVHNTSLSLVLTMDYPHCA